MDNCKNHKLKLLETHIIEQKENHYRFIYGYVRNPDDALDVLQDSIVKAIQKVQLLKDENAIKSWFYQIMSRTALDFIKKKKCTPSEPSIIEENLSAHEDHYEDFDLQKALANLPYEYRVIVHLRFFEMFKLDEIASILNLNVNTVKSRLYAALRKLKVELDLEEGWLL